MVRIIQWVLLALVISALNVNASEAPIEGLHWPQEIVRDEATIVIYQPQPEKLAGNLLTGRAAISLEISERETPIFGAMWFTSQIGTDMDTGVAIVRDLKVTRVAWPDSTEEQESRFTDVVEAAVPTAGFRISLERLSSSLDSAEIERKSLENLNTDPPKIVFSETLAVLLSYDGEPVFQDVEDSGYERAMNTPLVVVRNKRSSTLYLSNGTIYYESDNPLGPWRPTTNPPEDLVRVLPAPEEAAGLDLPPKIVVATEPTELIATDGEPEWHSLTGGKLLYVSNTETAWLRELATGSMYVLLSGRWFESKSEKGPWRFVKPDVLPESFSEIPPASDIGGTRVSVAGTQEAEQAITDAAIPQTAAINRAEASLEVTYDGAPKFQEIKGTRVSYAINTGAQVLRIDGQYYAVDNGVWFASDKPAGPWIVADSIPDEEIQKIPPTEPVYNTTYVKVYDATPEVVYVGYYPGYMWSFPYYGVPVYGTGWHYPPYYGGWYYPRPPTWGLHVGYNPWTGWNFGVSWSNGFLSMGVSWGGGWGPHYGPGRCCGGWYGGGYRGPVVINTGNINIGNNVNIGNRANIGNRLDNTNLKSRDISRPANRNLYNRSGNRTRVADSKLGQRDVNMARPAINRANDVFADRNGNVARRNGDNWDARRNNAWVPDRKTENRPATTARPGFDRQSSANMLNRSRSLDHREMNRAHQARSMGSAREMNRGRMSMGGGGLRRR